MNGHECPDELAGRYRTLFESMDEGFCVIEVLFDPDGRPIDFRYLEVNPAFERHNGLYQATGRTIRELAPDIETRWFDIYGNVAITGESIRFEEFSSALNRWFDLYAFRVGEEKEHQVAVLFKNITDRKHAEEALRASEERYRALSAATAEGVAVHHNGRIDFANESLVTMFGYEPEEVVGMEAIAFIAPEAREKAIALAVSGHEEPYESIGLRKDGTTFPVEFLGKGITLEGERRRVGLVRDLTRQKQAEAALRVSEERFRSIADCTPVVMWMTDAAGHQEFVNRAYRQFLGVTLEQVAGIDRWQPLVHLDDAAEYVGAFAESLRTRSAFYAQARVRRADGEWRWIASYGAPRFSPDGEFLGIAGSSPDITDLKMAEEALRQSEERFRVAQELSLDAFTILTAVRNADGRIVDFRWEYANPTAARLLRRSPEDLAGQQLLRVLPGNKANSDLFDRYVRVVETGEPHDYEIPYESEGIRGWFRNMTVKLEDGIAVYFADITERKEVEEALKALNEELENRVEQRTAELREKDQLLLLQSRQAAMGEMIGNIAHQWRQPLNSLGLTIQQLLLLHDFGKLSREVLDQTVSKSMELIQHMSKTIDDFRNYFRPDKERVEFRVSDIVADTLSLVEDSFRNQHIKVEVVSKTDPVIYGYRNELAQALLNLLSNAQDAIKERQTHDPLVTVTIDSEDGCTILTVTDNAGGIREEIMDKIFEPYFTTKGPQQGTGVGLFMSKSIIEKNMGGRLSARNIANGAEFRIEICDESRVNV